MCDQVKEWWSKLVAGVHYLTHLLVKKVAFLYILLTLFITTNKYLFLMTSREAIHFQVYICQESVSVNYM